MNNEHDNSVQEEGFAALLAHEQPGLPLSSGQVVKGRIVQIGPDSIFVDVQGKGEAVIDRAELEDKDGSLQVMVGDEIEATVIATDGEIRLSRKLLKGARAREALEMAAANRLPVEGKVTGVVKGGYEVTVAGLRAFCPFSQIDMRRVDPAEVLNQEFEFRIARYTENGRNIVLSRRQLLEEHAAQAAEETRKKIAPDAVLPGTVTSLTDFGAFIDLGGVQGLVPLSEISHARAGTPADRLHVGEPVTVKVLRVDAQKGKITLSLKALEGDPWTTVAGQLRERQIVSGRVARVTEFGAFVELLPGVDGLLHVSEIPRNQQSKVKDAATAHTEIPVMILSIDPNKRRISLALAPEGMAPGEQAEASTLAAGVVITGTVERVEPFGIFVRLGPGQTGLIPNVEMGTPRGTDHRKEFAPETEVKVVVLAVEEDGKRIRLSRSKALVHEEQAEAQAYQRDTAQKSGKFGVTLGDLLKQSRKN